LRRVPEILGQLALVLPVRFTDAFLGGI
jgi:hypothetical protein